MDLKEPRLIYLKGALFGLIVLLGSGAILLLVPDWRIAALLAMVIWASARAYYFMFYVVEKYVDPPHKFAGVWAFARYAWAKRRARPG